MKLLLDTHSFLWFIDGNAQLSSHARGLIEGAENERFISAVALWEIAIKIGIGKLVLTEAFGALIARELQTNSIAILPLTVDHLSRLIELPMHHRDPFDRLMAAQALVENAALVSADTAFDRHGVRREW